MENFLPPPVLVKSIGDEVVFLFTVAESAGLKALVGSGLASNRGSVVIE